MKYSYDNLEMTVTYRKDKEIEIRVANHNTFRVGNITVTTEYAGKKRTEFIGRIEAPTEPSSRVFLLPFSSGF